jgi:hypothetical protein
MSFKNIQQNNIYEMTEKRAVPFVSTSDTWVRNPSWSALPSVGNTEEKLVGLFAVFPDTNYQNWVAFVCTTAYHVDWGDGTNADIATNVRAEHLYDFADADLANTNAPVTFTDAGDTVNRTAHGYTNGMVITFANITTTTGISVNVPYYVVNQAADTFQVSLTAGGSAIALTNNGTGWILPYKQAIITITPQATYHLTKIDLNQKVATLAAPIAYTDGWLDICISGPNLVTLTMSSSSPSVFHTMLEKFQLISTNTITSFAYCFNNCYRLSSVPTFLTPSATSFSTLFQNCYNLRTFPTLDSDLVINFTFTFANCYSLVHGPVMDTHSATMALSSMFNGCYNLIDVPLYDFSAVAASVSSMFAGCSSLKKVPCFNFAGITSFASMFSGCSALEEVPMFNTVSANTMASMFLSCVSLKKIPRFNYASVTTLSSFANACYQLKEIAPLNTGTALTDTTLMFGYCSCLESVPLFDTSHVTVMYQMFYGCKVLREVPLFDTSAVVGSSTTTGMSSMFASCPSLRTVPLFVTSSCKYFTSMFSSCSSLETVPLFNTSAALNTNSMFASCSNLRTVPLFDLSKVVDTNSMFYSCVNLETVPNFNMAENLTTASMFSLCYRLDNVPAFSMPKCVNINSMFATCYSLRVLPAIDFTVVPVTTAGTFVSNAYALQSFLAKGPALSFSVAGNLSAAALDAMYTLLPTVTGTKVITVTGNYGVAGDTTSIATLKGWTVTG